MDDGFDCTYDPGTSTLTLVGGPGRDDDWARLWQEVERAFRRTACRLTVDLSLAAGLSAHQVGRIVQVCHRCFPGTVVRPPARARTAA